MASEKKQLRILLGVLDKMEVTYKEDIDLDRAKTKLEKAIEAGKSPDALNDDETEVLSDLGYDVEKPKKKTKTAPADEDEDEEPAPKKKVKKSDDEDEEEEAPKKKAKKVTSDDDEDEEPAPKKKAKSKEKDEDDGAGKPKVREWLLEYLKANKGVERDVCKAAFLEEFGKDKENTLHGALWRAKSDAKYLDGKILVEKKIFTLAKAEVTEEEDEEPAPKKKAKPSKDEDEDDEPKAKKTSKAKAKKDEDDDEDGDEEE